MFSTIDKADAAFLFSRRHFKPAMNQTALSKNTAEARLDSQRTSHAAPRHPGPDAATETCREGR